MPTPSLATLRQLLLDLFEVSELRILIAEEFGDELEQAVSWKQPPADVAFEVVRALERRQLVNDTLRDMLIARRKRAAEPIRRAWGDGSAPAGDELSEAITRLDALKRAGADTSVVEAEILELKRGRVLGRQLKEGDELLHEGQARFLLLERLGAGGFATVWRARDMRASCDVAVKVLHAQFAQDRSRRERFFRGAREMAKLDHPAVVRVLVPQGEHRGAYYFVMELVEGEDLNRAVLGGRLAREDVVPLMLQVGAGLAAAHAAGLVHRDIKPGNILLDRQSRPKLTDFDLVAAEHTTANTRTGAMGTFVYAAPEQLDRPQDVDARADVYGLGMTTLFALHGQKLSPMVVRNASHAISELPCSDTVKAVLERAVSWKLEERYSTAAAYCEALKRVNGKQQAVTDAEQKSTVLPLGEGSPRNIGGETGEPRRVVNEPTSLPEATKSKRVAGSGSKSERFRLLVRGGAVGALVMLLVMGAFKMLDEHPKAVTRSVTSSPTVAQQRAPSCPKGMVLVDGGAFIMGSYADGSYNLPREVDVEPFCLDNTEVTVDAYSRCWGCSKPDMGSFLCNFGKTGKGRHPVNCVDWNQASVYCSKKGPRRDEKMRLPTEEEWEFAARGPEGRRYPWGSEEPNGEQLNARGGEQTSLRMFHESDGYEHTAPVGSFPKGQTPKTKLMDMAGNVYEWTSSPYIVDDKAEHDNVARVIRGGSWNTHDPSWVRGAFRSKSAPGHRVAFVGFRCARDI